MFSFEDLETFIPSSQPLRVDTKTDFWENLYQLFKSRMIAEMKAEATGAQEIERSA